MLKLTADGCQETAELPDTGCCPPPLCGNSLCCTFVAFFQQLPSGPLWSYWKEAAISYFQRNDDPRQCPLLTNPACPSVVLHAIYAVLKLKKYVSDALWPALRESDPMTAVTTLDEWLERLRWEDCFLQACRSRLLGGLTPYEIMSDCGPVFCPPNFPPELIAALKHNIVRALTRANMGIIKNLCGLSWVIEPLGAEVRAVLPYAPAPVPVNWCDSGCPSGMKLMVAATRDWIEGAGTGELCEPHPLPRVKACFNRGCDRPAGLPEEIWPGLLAAECIIRSLVANMVCKEEVIALVSPPCFACPPDAVPEPPDPEPEPPDLGVCELILVSGSGAGPSGPATNDDYWAVSATSTDGVTWTNINSFIQFPGWVGGAVDSIAFTCAICSEPADSLGSPIMPVIMAGGFMEYPHAASGPTQYINVPAAAISTNGGATWTHLAMFPLPATTGVQGLVVAVGYDSAGGGQFYATVHWNDGTSIHLLTYKRTGTWELIDDIDFSVPGSESILAYPPGTRVCDTLNMTGTGLVFCSSSGFHQVISITGHTIARAATSNISILIDGVEIDVPGMDYIESVAATDGIILVGGTDAFDYGVHAVSTDLGVTWNPIPALTDIYGPRPPTGEYAGGFAPVFTIRCAAALETTA